MSISPELKNELEDKIIEFYYKLLTLKHSFSLLEHCTEDVLTNERVADLLSFITVTRTYLDNMDNDYQEIKADLGIVL